MKLHQATYSRIDSPANERVKQLAKMVGNTNALRAQGLACAEGLHLCAELFKHLPRHLREVWIPEPLLNHAEWLALHPLECAVNTRFVVVPPAVYKKMSSLSSPTGPLVVFAPPEDLCAPNLENNLLVLDGIQDPGNVGVVLRNAAAAGIQQVAYSAQSAWVWGDKTLRAGMGAQFALRFCKESTVLDALQSAHTPPPIRSTCLSDRSESLYQLDLTTPGVWVFGSEGQGVSQAWLQRATVHVRIPQSNAVESLNVASSSAVCLFEQRRQCLQGSTKQAK